MFLKQIEIIGFKSFAKKISVDFVPGVTAVVGPNGSGKSNIADAIKWVLGEQSAKTLRGSKMEDIIFAGSDAKRALNMAEVTLTLDNSDQHLPYDYNEISVTRRVYRSGDSEFLINGQTCRLKDIVDLFMDSGLGREAYSIISQGKIDAILNSKAEEKRKIFEEAAGVLKYKTRKQAAAKKLTESDDHLNRVEDIIFELEGQVEPLREQASIAKDYLEKKSELERIDVALLAHDIAKTHQAFEAQQLAVDKMDHESESLLATLAEKDGLFLSGKENLKSLQQQMDKLQNNLVTEAEALEKLEGQKNVLQERQKFASENTEDLKERIAKLEEKYREGIVTLNRENDRLTEEKGKATQLKDLLKEKEGRLQFLDEDLETVLEGLKSDYFELLNKKTTVKNEKNYATERVNHLHHREGKISSQVTDYEEKKAILSEKKSVLAKQHNNHTQTAAACLEELKNTQTLKEEALSRYEKVKEALRNIEQYIQQAQSKKEMLEAMSDDYAGFFQGVKLILRAKDDSLSGIHGAVAELLQVEKRYEAAIEIALGGQLQNIAVENEASARQAITFLKQRKGGRATLLPLNVIKSRRMSLNDQNRLASEEGFIGLGSELVTCEPMFQTLKEHLLGHIIIARDLKLANNLARLVNYRYRIVTIEGDVVNPGGAMTGGSQNQKSTSLIGRQREIDQLQTQLNEMKIQRENIKTDYTALQNSLVDFDIAIKEKTELKNRANEGLQQIEQSIRDLSFESKALNERYDLVIREQNDFQDEHKELTVKIEALKEKEQIFNQQKVVLEKKIETMSDEKKNQQSSKEELRESITELKIQYASQSERLTAQREKTDRLTAELDIVKSDLDEAVRTVDDFTEHLQLQATDRESLDEQIVHKRREKEQLTSEITELRSGLNEKQSKLNEQEQTLKTLQNQERYLSEERQQLKMTLNRLEIKLDNLIDTLRQDYELSYEYAVEHYSLESDPEDARKKVKLLKKSIDELGTVNIGAIEEYDRVSSRYEFLQTQRDDLLQAKETLLSVMSEMDQEVIKRFDKAFFKIRAQFQEIFKALFGGGKADLALTDQADLLNSGVDILAQPPGKKLQHLSLLSGGERALTAIALLFAILKVRPVPFCVLDEVEAALDDANVDRYANYLKVFSQETQFIVVTHRKGTMELADVLYGVTMQESGVSKLVSVRLEETKELIET